MSSRAAGVGVYDDLPGLAVLARGVAGVARAKNSPLLSDWNGEGAVHGFGVEHPASPRMRGVADTDGVPRRRGRYGPRGMAVRGRARCPTWTSFSPPRARCSPSLRALPRRRHGRHVAGAASTRARSSRSARRERRRAASPAITCRQTYNLWLVGHQLGTRRGTVARSVLVPAGSRPAARPQRAGCSACRLLAARGRSRTSSPGTPPPPPFVLAGARRAWLRALELPAGAALDGRARLRARALPGRAERPATCSGCRVPAPALSRRVRAGARGALARRRRGAHRDPALRPGTPRARRDPVRARVRGRPRGASWLARARRSAAIAAGIAELRGDDRCSRRSEGPLSEVGLYSAEVGDFLARDVGLERFVYVGWAPPVLALVVFLLVPPNQFRHRAASLAGCSRSASSSPPCSRWGRTHPADEPAVG